MSHRATVLLHHRVTHDVHRFILDRPASLEFQPGQALTLSLDRDGWRDEERPFTPTSLPDERVLELTIKSYPDHDGVTSRLASLEAGDAVLLSEESFGAIVDRGPGLFVAGGAGITPFLAILRARARRGELEKCALLFSNKTHADVMLEQELSAYLGPRVRFVCTQERVPHFDFGRIDAAMLRKTLERFAMTEDSRAYLCGPDAMVEELSAALSGMGVNPESVVTES